MGYSGLRLLAATTGQESGVTVAGVTGLLPGRLEVLHSGAHVARELLDVTPVLGWRSTGTRESSW